MAQDENTLVMLAVTRCDEFLQTSSKNQGFSSESNCDWGN